MNVNKLFVLILTSWMVVMSLLLAKEEVVGEISKEKLFSTPPLISAKISPDGHTIAYVGADTNGITNVFIAKKSKESYDYSQVTFFERPEIIQFFWSADSKKILFLKEEDGTGRLHLHSMDIRSKKHFVYTKEFSQITTKVIKVSSSCNKAIIGLNNRNPHFHDLYLLDLDSGNLHLLLKNDSYAKFLASDDLEIVLKVKINDDGSWTVITHKDVVFMHLKAEDAFQTEFISYDEKKQAVYLLDNRFSNTNQLALKPLFEPSVEKILGSQSYSDIDEVLFINGEPKAYASYYTQKKWHVLDPLVEQDLTFLEGKLGSNFEVLNLSNDGNIWIISNSIPDRGTNFWIYERQLKQLSSLQAMDHEKKGSQEPYSKMYEMVVTARDGKKLICYYTLPKEHDQGGKVHSPIPLIVVPHGGPFKVRDKYEFNPYHQWLAKCGYAVLSVNFRLSSGFGKDFVNAGNGEWGGKAHLDIIDAVEACITKGITSKNRLAIFGGSYGGYESLASLTFSPDYFTCCVSICGPSNLKTVLDNVPKFWEFTAKPLSDKLMFFTKHAFIISMGGDPDQEKGIQYLEKCSPLNYLEWIKAPLLLIHGQNDHVVSEKESRQIYDSMKKNNKNVTYVLFPDEGHRLAKFANKMVYLTHVESFLSQHLKGRCYPIDHKIIAESSAIIFN